MRQNKVGQFIALRRKECGLTQSCLAEKMNVSDKAVSKWETGKCFPDSDKLFELCAILKISVNELFTGEHISSEKYRLEAEQNIVSLQEQMTKIRTKNSLLLKIILFSFLVSVAILCSFLVYNNTNYNKFNNPEIIAGTFINGDELKDPEYIVIDQKLNIYRYHQFDKVEQGKIERINDSNYYLISFNDEQYYLIYHTNYAEILKDKFKMSVKKISNVVVFVNVEKPKD
ncbi:MAG: helix-turn-helix transcriptional regulator [Erysipelotrichia bacterium]|nr:helix-turn-helix transcriptional regulator [Erysipelotrichia bacterium]